MIESDVYENWNCWPVAQGRWISLILFLSCLFGQPAVSATTALPTYDRVRILAEARPIQDAELTDQDGRPFRLSKLHGQVTLVFFGFTNCPDVCPLAMQRLSQLEKSGGSELAKVAYVMISVDGDRDSPKVLKNYLARFSPRFIGLTGEPGSVKPIAKEFSAAFFKGSALGEDGNYTVTHSPQIFLLDSAGRLRAEFYNASVEAMRGVTMALLEQVPASDE
jgi:protein SCO1/2